MHTSHLDSIVIDCDNAGMNASATFWARALGYEASRYPDAADAHYLRLESPPGEVNVLLQRVDHPSRVHLDIETDDDIEPEARRARGARRPACGARS